jgi:hypothetical protein
MDAFEANWKDEKSGYCYYTDIAHLPRSRND